MCCLQATESQIGVNDLRVFQATHEVGEEDDDDVRDFEAITEDTDEEYVPIAESSSPSTSTARKRRAQCDAGKTESGEAAEDDSKKDSVQCPICDKSFKSKYYLKVHNRCTTQSSVLALEVSVERAATNVSLS